MTRRLRQLLTFSLIILAARGASATCTFTREMFYRDGGETAEHLWRAAIVQELTPDVYGLMNSFHSLALKKVGDFFFSKFSCGANETRMDVTYETNTIPLTINWLTQWEGMARLEYGKTYELKQSLGERSFVVRFHVDR